MSGIAWVVVEDEWHRLGEPVFKMGFEDKLAAAFDDTGIQWLASWPGAAQAKAVVGRRRPSFVCWDEEGGLLRCPGPETR